MYTNVHPNADCQSIGEQDTTLLKTTAMLAEIFDVECQRSESLRRLDGVNVLQ